MADWAADRGAELDVLHAPVVSAWPDPRDAGAVVALGSDRSVHASKDPWIGAQVAFLREAHTAGVPVLGICFGAQALAAALGATVSRAAETEIGWVDVQGDDGVAGRWFTWHEDVFDLPPGAIELGAPPRPCRRSPPGPAWGCSSTPRSRRRSSRTGCAGARDEGPDAEPICAETARSERAGPRAGLRADGPNCCPLAALTVRHVSIHGP